VSRRESLPQLELGATRLIRDKKINPWDEKEPIEKRKEKKERRKGRSL
jgi:hypothetical protein